MFYVRYFLGEFNGLTRESGVKDLFNVVFRRSEKQFSFSGVSFGQVKA